MRVIPGNAQHIGDRERQEDAFGFSSLYELGDRAFERHGGVMMVLCDGMGGLANGAAASRAAVEAALHGYRGKQPSEDIPSALNRALREAHQAVCAICEEGGTAGSTIVMAVVWRDELYWASLGDSRLYLCRENAPAVQLTEDHNVASLLEQRVARGENPAEEAATAMNRDALTAYLGAPYPPQPHMGQDGLPLRSGDRIIACSDGVYRGLSPEAMAAVARHGDPMMAAEHMIRSVVKQRLPHQDNLTVVLLEVSSHRRPIDIFEAVSPTARGALYGAAGGFGAAAALVGVLIGFGVLRIGHADRQPVNMASPPQTSLGSPPAKIEPVTPPPTTSGEQHPAPSNAPATPGPAPSNFLPPHAADGKSQTSPSGSGTKAQPGNQ
jgi:serine/threonine protein phosphatase PrpC